MVLYLMIVALFLTTILIGYSLKRSNKNLFESFLDTLVIVVYTVKYCYLEKD